MTTHLRYAIGTATAGLALIGLAIFLAVNGQPWPALSALGSAVLLAWDTRREAVLHQRRLAEHDLARRRAEGETVPALDPCCLLNPRTKGLAHDHRCTMPGPAIHVLHADDTTAGWTAYERLAARVTESDVRSGLGTPANEADIGKDQTT
ncbi:hypothetical protein ACW4TU_18580 [Streptomyces sp. QTS52]